MARQTVKWDEWIVGDGGKVPATLTMGQIHSHVPCEPGAKNFAGNVLRALELATGDVVIVIEDDDWYRADHIEVCLKGLETRPCYGTRKLHYYNIAVSKYAVFGNIGAALCQTALRREMMPRMINAARSRFACNSHSIDGTFWLGYQHNCGNERTVTGMKGLPGNPGLGIGHRPNTNRSAWRPDPTGAKLREWIGEDAEAYANLS
jgi:hypothetical protein